MRPFLWLWSGQAVSLFGTQVVQFALIWWLTVETGSAAVLAVATLVGLLPRVVLGPFLGVAVDRLDRKAVMLAADTAAATAAAALLGLFAAGLATPPWVLALLAIRAVAEALHEPAMLASTTLMVPEEHLTRIQGMNQSLQGLLTIVAAPVGALAVSALPMPAVLGIDIATAAFAVAVLIAVRVPTPVRKEEAARPSPLREGIDGLRYLARRRGHMALLGMAASVNLFLTPAFALLPLLVVDRLGGRPMELGGLTSLFGLGMLAGGILLGTWGGFRRRIDTTLVGMAVLGAAVLAVGVGDSLSFARVAVALFVVGAAATLANGPIQAIFQATVDPAYQGRVFSLFGSLATLTTPLGLALAAPVAERWGVGLWYLAGGAACGAMALVGALSPALRGIEKAPEGGPEATPSDAPAEPIIEA